MSVAAAEVQLIAWMAGRRVPFCLYSAQNIEKRYPWPFRWLERIALHRATAVHTCNEEAGHILRRKGFHGLICNLGLGIDIDRLAPSEPSHADGTLHVGYVGRLESHKGVDVLVEAATRVHQCTLRIVGDGPERAAIERRIAASGAMGRISLVGYVAQADMPNQYRQFDVLAVPSLDTPGWIEQFGRVAVEAMASGVPVVASDSGSLPEVIGDTGVLVTPGDVTALAEALHQLADDRSERRRLGKCARERAERYSWVNIARTQGCFYRTMLRDSD